MKDGIIWSLYNFHNGCYSINNYQGTKEKNSTKHRQTHSTFRQKSEDKNFEIIEIQHAVVERKRWEWIQVLWDPKAYIIRGWLLE